MERVEARPALHLRPQQGRSAGVGAAVVSGRDQRDHVRHHRRRPGLGLDATPARSSGADARTTSPTSRTSASSPTAGVAYCDNSVFLLTLDMTIVALDPATGQQLARVPISQAVPGAQSNYGYSETSAPICADHHLIVGAAGSEYGARGFVMAYNTPTSRRPGRTRSGRFRRTTPSGGARRRSSAEASSGRRRRSTRRRTRSTSAPARRRRPYYPSAPAGPRPTSRLDHRDRPEHGSDEVVAAAAVVEPVVVRHSQPPMVYTAKIGGKTERIVSVATMEGVWFAYNAATGAPIYQRVKVIDNVEHPNLEAGPAGRDLSVVARRAQLLARLVRSADAVRLQRRLGDGLGPRPADPAEEERRGFSPATCSSGSPTATTGSTSSPAGRTTAR